MNSEKEQDRLNSLKIIEQRYSFLFEDVWFILLQYMYFEKFVFTHTKYLAPKISMEWMIFNALFTALIGLLRLTTIPYCLKMIKQEKTKTSIFYLMTFIQIILQTLFPFMRAVLLILQVKTAARWYKNDDYPLTLSYSITDCTLVGFQV